MKRIYTFIKPGIFPLTICLFLLGFSVLYQILNLPSPKELVNTIINLFDRYGYALLFVAAVVEGIFIVGMYFPGSLAIALAVYTLGSSILNLVYIGIVAFSAFLLANIFNYFLGKYGYYKFLLLIGNKDVISNMEASMRKNGSKTFFLTGFFPNFIAITTVCAGIGNLGFFKTLVNLFYSLLFWVTVWTILGSLLVKKIDLQNENQSLYIIAIIFGWAVFLIVKDNFFKGKGKSTQ